MTLDKLQARFVDEILHGKGHVVLTGRAGTGKSTALSAGVKAAQAAQMDILVMAPTAMAASIHRDAGLESGTIHHALKWNPAREPLPRKLLSVCG
ncbi:MAG TPA: AAA family ATPase, partial [Synergistaceae bacterium]|nr:AAA family ATPase [Synergistaceae bacterium]